MSKEIRPCGRWLSEEALEEMGKHHITTGRLPEDNKVGLHTIHLGSTPREVTAADVENGCFPGSFRNFLVATLRKQK